MLAATSQVWVPILSCKANVRVTNDVDEDLAPVTKCGQTIVRQAAVGRATGHCGYYSFYQTRCLSWPGPLYGGVQRCLSRSEVDIHGPKGPVPAVW